ncbi:MAG: TIM barrel protein [Oscillospiraceae bacterium]|nr:TIM barrel protein [Oscillospiraceae bacterium]
MGIERYAYAIWPWGVEEKEQFVTAVREIAPIGYRYFESVHDTIGLYRNDVSEFLDVCEEFGVEPASFYFHLSGDRDKDIQGALEKIPFLEKTGVHRMTLQAIWVGERKATKEEVLYTVECADLLARAAQDHGVKLSLHPHCNTAMMFEDEIDYIMAQTNPDRVFFCPDTAHLVGGKCDPVEMVRRYAGRTAFTHLKDIKGTGAVSSGMSAGVEVYSNFTELGNGCVDFPAVIRELNKAGYTGFWNCELDVASESNRRSAEICFAYLKKAEEEAK